MYPVINGTNTETIAISAVAASFAKVLTANIRYSFMASVDCYVLQGAAPTATAGAGASRFVAAGRELRVSGDNGAVLSVVAGGAGFATISPAQE